MTCRKWLGLGLAIIGLAVALWGAYVGSTAPILAYIQRVSSWGNPVDAEAKTLKDVVESKYLLSNCLLVIGTFFQIAGAMLSTL